MTTDMRRALAERRDLIEARATAILDTALRDSEPWIGSLGAEPKDERTAAVWRRAGQTVAAYRDRYQITGPSPLGAPPETEVQKIDAARAKIAIDRARGLTANQTHLVGPQRQVPQGREAPR